MRRKCIAPESGSSVCRCSYFENVRTWAVHPCYVAAAMARKMTTAIAAIVAGTSLFAVLRWLRSRPEEKRTEEMDSGTGARADALVDEADLESFPASDPPSWTLGGDQIP